jgi:hypothetical protein
MQRLGFKGQENLSLFVMAARAGGFLHSSFLKLRLGSFS